MQAKNPTRRMDVARRVHVGRTSIATTASLRFWFRPSSSLAPLGCARPACRALLGAGRHRAGRVVTRPTPYSVNRLTGYLKSLGHNAPKSAVSDYLAWFEDAYFFFSVRLFDASLARSHSNPKKAYCVDHAVIPSLASGVLVNAGHLLENLVFTGLRRAFPDVFYGKTKAGREVDFVVPVRTRSPLLIQSCESLADPQTRKREVSALSEAMGEMGCKTGTIVTRGEDEHIDTDSGTIKVVPVWKFLLKLPEAEE
jgi:predicted AAA+ superfamily ATPase